MIKLSSTASYEMYKLKEWEYTGWKRQSNTEERKLPLIPQTLGAWGGVWFYASICDKWKFKCIWYTYLLVLCFFLGQQNFIQNLKHFRFGLMDQQNLLICFILCFTILYTLITFNVFLIRIVKRMLYLQITVQWIRK